MNDKAVLITGAGKGIGKSIYAELSAKGYNCITPTRSELDLSSAESIDRYFSNFTHDIYALVNNAGINILSDIESVNNQNIKDMFSVNLEAPLRLIKYVSKGMKSRRSGKIVNISSIWGVRSKEFRTLYSATKFGINGITKALARELGEYDILVNSVAPGYVNTELTDKNVSREEQENIKKNIPLGRFAETSEIAKLVAFLVSDENTYITGQTMVIDGGFLS